jgi:uncharacterized membrane protein
MKQISYWASRNKWTARCLLVGCYVLLNGFALIAGELLTAYDIEIPFAIVYAVGFVLLIAAALYPSKQHRSNHYFRQKLLDFVLVTCSFLIVIITVNDCNRLSSTTDSFYSQANASSVSHPVEKLSKKKQLRLLKLKIKAAITEMKKGPKGERVLAIIISVILLSGLLSLVAALSCSLSCSGMEGLSYVVLFLGIGIVIFLFVRILRVINKRYRKQMAAKEPKETIAE